MKTQDRLGRWLFTTHTTTPISQFQPNERQLRWLQFLNLHGMAASNYLHEYTAKTHRCPQTSKRMLRRLFDGGLIYKPAQQRETAGADGNHHVYALTKAGIQHLKDTELWVDALQPTGPWVHQYMVACITATIHILSERAGYAFIPGHHITSNLTVDVPFDWKGRQHNFKLIPDSLFAIKYSNGYIAYLVEADRNTEPNDPSSPYRKSIRRNVKQYASLIGNGLYKEAYGLKCDLMVLNVVVSKHRIRHGLKILNQEVGPCRYQAYGIAPMFKTPFTPPDKLLHELFSGRLIRNQRRYWSLVQ